MLTPAEAAFKRFLTEEVGERNLPRLPHATLAAIGRIAGVALQNPLLRQPLSDEGIAPSEFIAHSGPDRLLSDDRWDIALVISPYKACMAEFCDSLGDRARLTGVVDTLLRNDHMVFGLNTNSYAAEAAIALLIGDSVPERILIIGTGASARSVAVAAKRLFDESLIVVAGRSSERAAALTGDLHIGEPLSEDIGHVRPDLLIHATTVGETTDTERLEPDPSSLLLPGLRVLDLTNRLTLLQQQALANGCCTMSGNYMQLFTNRLRVALLSGAFAGYPDGL